MHSAVLVWQAWQLRKLTETTIEHEGNLGYLVEELRDLVEGLRHDRADDAPPLTRVLYRPGVLGQWFDGIRSYATASSRTRSCRTWAGLR